jgi:hypothetical protein
VNAANRTGDDMAKINHYSYIPTLEDFSLLNWEFSRTRQGKLRKRKVYGIIVGVFLAIMLVVFFAFQIWFKKYAPPSAISIGPFVLDRSIIFVLGLIGISYLALLVRLVFFQKGVLRQVYNNHPELQSPKIFDISEEFLHERSNYSECWFQWNAIYQATKTENFYILSATDTTGNIYIPIRCLDDNGKTFLDGLINKLSENSRDEKYTLQLDNEIQPEPLNKHIRLSHTFDLCDRVLSSFEKTWYLSDQYKLFRIGAIGMLVCSLGFLIIPVSELLLHLEPDFKLLYLLLITAVVFFSGPPIYHIILNIIDHLIDKNKHICVNYLIDENGFFRGRGSTAANLNWSGFSKIIIARRNYLFKTTNNKRVFAIPKKWLKESERHTMDEILTTVANNTPGLILKIIK